MNVFVIGKIKHLIIIKSRYLRFEPTQKYHFRKTNKFVCIKYFYFYFQVGQKCHLFQCRCYLLKKHHLYQPSSPSGWPDAATLCRPHGPQRDGEAAVGAQGKPQLHHNSRTHSTAHRFPRGTHTDCQHPTGHERPAHQNDQGTVWPQTKITSLLYQNV